MDKSSTTVDSKQTTSDVVDDRGLRRRKRDEDQNAPADTAVDKPTAAQSAPADGRYGEAPMKAKVDAPAKAKVDGVALVDWHFKRAALVTVVWFVVLAVLSYLLCPSERIERLEGIERTAATLAAATLAVSCLSTVHLSFSGVIAAALVVQLCAITTDVLMASAPVPVMIDPVTGSRVHMLRWSEFPPLAFLMTLLTEGGDMVNDPERGVRAAYIQAICQGASTTFGLIFPFCPGFKSWLFSLITAIVLFLPIFFRVGFKMRAIRSMEPNTKKYRRSSLCLRLLIVETVVWSALVVGYLATNVGPALLRGVPKLQNPAITMIYDCSMDVISKVVYMALIVNVHDAIFSEHAATRGDQQTLEEKELRRQMRKQRKLEKERREAERAKKKEADASAGDGAKKAGKAADGAQGKDQ